LALVFYNFNGFTKEVVKDPATGAQNLDKYNLGFPSKDVAENPQLNARDWFAPVEHPELGTTVKYPGPPYRLSETPWRIARRPPCTGEHNREVYGELGLSPADLEVLSAAGAI
jgi:crotonobetainyl-CoA:carnitine CoA-transferase CaiB-like acyl-CoA transferase